jgi:hypothetical protein
MSDRKTWLLLITAIPLLVYVCIFEPERVYYWWRSRRRAAAQIKSGARVAVPMPNRIVEILAAQREVTAASARLRPYARHNRECYERMCATNAPCDCGFAESSDALDAALDRAIVVLGESVDG